jgi:uncharacterized protein (TIGR03437 family)
MKLLAILISLLSCGLAWSQIPNDGPLRQALVGEQIQYDYGIPNPGQPFRCSFHEQSPSTIGFAVTALGNGCRISGATTQLGKREVWGAMESNGIGAGGVYAFTIYTVEKKLGWETQYEIPSARIGKDYEYQFTASGGFGQRYYFCHNCAGELGSSFAMSEDGLLRGRPSRSGYFQFTGSVSDDSRIGTQKIFRLYVAPDDQLRLPAAEALPPASLGQAFSYTLTAQGGTAPYTFSLALGPLAPGVAIAGNGLISGVPTQAGDFPFTFRVTDREGTALTRNLILRVQRTGLQISATSLPTAQRGVVYSQQLAATGGTPPYAFSLVSGDLPPGIVLGLAGLLQGTPTTVGSFRARVRASDSAATIGEAEINITVSAAAGPLSIRSTSLGAGSEFAAYRFALAADGGTPTYRFSLSRSDSLPLGLRLAADGSLSGTPLQSGEFIVGIEVTDAAGQTAYRDVSLRIAAPVYLPAGTALSDYRQRFGEGSWRYELDPESPSKLPLGLRLEPDGSVSGFLWVAGEHIFSVRRTLGTSAEKQTIVLHSIPPIAAFQVEDWGLAQGATGAAYWHALAASKAGSQVPANWKLVEGGLPPGLRLSTSGLIDGVPTQVGTWGFTVEASAANRDAASAALWIHVTEAGSPRLTAPLSSASYRGGMAAPGELLVLFGNGMSIAPLLLTAPIREGAIPAAWSPLTVSIDGVNAPVLYANTDQASIFTPFGLRPNSIATMRLRMRGRLFPPWTLRIAPAKVGIYTLDGTGSGGAAALNADGSLHSSQRPAPRGGVIVFFGTGFGAVEPASGDGQVATGAAQARATVEAWADATQLEVLYAGNAPGLVAGVGQMNLQLPESLSPGMHEVVIRAGGVASAPVRIWVQ